MKFRYKAAELCSHKVAIPVSRKCVTMNFILLQSFNLCWGLPRKHDVSTSVSVRVASSMEQGQYVRADSSPAWQEITHILWIAKVCCRNHKSRTESPLLSSIVPFHFFIYDFSNCYIPAFSHLRLIPPSGIFCRFCLNISSIATMYSVCPTSQTSWCCHLNSF